MITKDEKKHSFQMNDQNIQSPGNSCTILTVPLERVYHEEECTALQQEAELEQENQLKV